MFMLHMLLCPLALFSIDIRPKSQYTTFGQLTRLLKYFKEMIWLWRHCSLPNRCVPSSGRICGNDIYWLREELDTVLNRCSTLLLACLCTICAQILQHVHRDGKQLWAQRCSRGKGANAGFLCWKDMSVGNGNGINKNYSLGIMHARMKKELCVCLRASPSMIILQPFSSAY